MIIVYIALGIVLAYVIIKLSGLILLGGVFGVVGAYALVEKSLEKLNSFWDKKRNRVIVVFTLTGIFLAIRVATNWSLYRLSFN
jgi:hypothetical protein